MLFRTRGADNLFLQLRSSLREPEFWAYSSWLDIVTRYRRSRLGVLWILLPPLLYVGGIGYFYGKLLGASVLSFIPHLGLGYLLFRMISMVINESASVLPGHQSFILDGHVRLTDFVLRVIAKALFYFVAALPVIAVAVSFAPGLSLIGAVLSAGGFFLVLLNLVWLATIIGLVGARFPDIHELMGSIFIFAFILTPILWSADRAPLNSLHGVLMRMNPLFHLVEVVRAPLLGERLDPTTPFYLAVMTVAGWLLAYLFYRRYARFVPLWM